MNLLILILLAAEIPSLGVISPKHAVVLTHESTRSDFAGFTVEFIPKGTTNAVKVGPLKTDLLTVEHLGAVPSGEGVMGIQCAYENGDTSDIALFRYDLRRGRPQAPSARLVEVLGASEPSGSVTNELRKIRERRATPKPPTPEYTSGLDIATVQRKQIVDSAPPLPGGTNQSYGQFLDRIADSVNFGRRRNQ